MSEFVEVEWFGREQKIGVVLTYDQHDGFKARMAPLPGPHDGGETQDIEYLMREAAKIPAEWAYGIFGKRMISEYMRRNLWDKSRCSFRYDRVNYKTNGWLEAME